MPIFVYVLLGIALLISALLFTKIKIFVCYENDVKIYGKFLFYRFDIIPKKPKIKKAKKSKKKSQKPKETKFPLQEQVKEKSLPSKIWDMRTALLKILEKFSRKLHFKFIKLRVVIGCDNAAKTALVYAGVNQGISYLIEILRNISNVDVSSRADISVNSDFISQKSEFEGKIELYMRVTSVIYVGFHAIKEYIKFKSNKED